MQMYRNKQQDRSNYLFILAFVPERTSGCSHVCLANILYIELNDCPLPLSSPSLPWATPGSNRAVHSAAWWLVWGVYPKAFPASHPPIPLNQATPFPFSPFMTQFSFNLLISFIPLNSLLEALFFITLA